MVEKLLFPAHDQPDDLGILSPTLQFYKTQEDFMADNADWPTIYDIPKPLKMVT
jgi:hypothetical protein